MEDENKSNDNLGDGIDKIFDKLKQFLSQQNIEDIPGITPEQVEEMKDLFSQFDDIKTNLKVEIHNLDPFTKGLFSSIMGQFGKDDINIITPASSDINSLQQKEAEVEAQPNDIDKRSALLDEIDRQLSRQDLSDDEMNELLDKRMKILDGLE